jgi:phosphate ABC transporter phosphate-binding protein
MKTKYLGIATAVVAILAILGYVYFSASTSKPNEPGQPVTLNGAGASFPYPLIDKWRFEYTSLKPHVTVNYQSIGSGGGIKAITDKTVEFGASDAPLTDETFKGLPGILHIPETIGAVAVVYNVPNVTSGLKLTGEALSQIYLGKITKWNDQKITSLNPGVQLPDKEILIVHRSDGSGTTFVFTDYLSNVSQEWATEVGKGTSVSWPVGVGGKGNEGVAGAVKQNQFSIGYVELAYAKKETMTYALIQNREGKFIEPTLETTRAAATSAAPILPKGDQSWSKVTIVNPSGSDSYPIASFTYLLVYKDQVDQMKGKALVDFLWWVIHDGQKYAPSLDYVPLPDEVVKLNEETLKLVNHKGQAFLR